jgi:glycosyltransferase involved in cell wall biosynthesis
MRVLHAPVNVGNQPWVLSRAERAHGVRSDLIVSYSTWLGYPADKVLGRPGGRSPREFWRRGITGLIAPIRYDVLHYYFGKSLLYRDDAHAESRWPFLDVRIARWLGRKIFFTLQGCDVRLAEESHARNQVTMCAPGGCSVYPTCLARFDAQRRRLIQEILPLADRVFFLNPELGHYLPDATFLPYANVPVHNVTPVPPSTRRRPRVLHAPSNDTTKGSQMIEAALAQLTKRYDFDYVSVRGIPHAEAMNLYADCDIVIDQVLAGWYGGFAVELMAMGKPVACYMREEDLHFVPPGMRDALPLLRVDPRRLVEDLDNIFAHRDEWPKLGAAARKFVLTWHDPQRIAAAMIAAYRDPQSRFELAPPAS